MGDVTRYWVKAGTLMVDSLDRSVLPSIDQQHFEAVVLASDYDALRRELEQAQERMKWLEEGRNMIVYEVNRGHSGKCSADCACPCPVCDWLAREPQAERKE